MPSGRHVSVVHRFPSSHVSPGLHLTHPAMGSLWPVQPVVASHALSTVHGSWSSQSEGKGRPDTQTPPRQVSRPLQSVMSSQGLPSSGVLWQRPLSHTSAVHGFPSSHAGLGPFGLHGFCTQSPFGVVGSQIFPGPQSFSAPCWQPLLASQVSGPSVQGFWSSQETPRCWQPAAGTHESVVHTFKSSQSFAPPPRHPAPRQVSPVVQRLPSSHVVPSCSGSFWHPYTGLQASDVQVLPSSQVARAGRRQWGSQPSQSAGLPSSHSSGNSGGAPLPHAGQGTRQPSGTSARVVGSRPVHSGRTKPAGHGARGGLMILAPAVCGGVLEHAVLVPVWRVVRTAPLTVIPLRPITRLAAGTPPASVLSTPPVIVT